MTDRTVITSGTLTFLNKYDEDMAYNWTFNVEYPVVTYKGASYIAIDQPEVGQLPDENPKVWQLLGKFEGGDDKVKFDLPLRYNEKGNAEIYMWDYAFAVAGEPEDEYDPPKGSLIFGDEFLADLNNALDNVENAIVDAKDAKKQADLAIEEIELLDEDLGKVRTTANTAKVTADKAVQKLIPKETTTVKMKVTEGTNKEFEISAELVNPAPTPDNKIALYNFVYGKGYNIVYDKTVIPSVSVVSVKDKIPSKELSISVTYILDSFYPDSAKYLVVCVNLGKTTVKIKGVDTVVSKDLLVYKRFLIEVKTPTKALFVDTDYVSFKFDPTVIFANPELCNFNQELINITANSYESAGYIDDYPVWIDDANPSGTSWSKLGKAGTGGLITLANQSYFYYDGRQVNAGNLVVDFTIDMQRNIFTNGFTKYLVFKGETTEALPSHKLKIIIKANSDTNIQSNVPYRVLNKKEVAFVFDMSNAKDNIRNQVAVTLVCTNNSLMLMAFQFAEVSVK